MLLTGKKLASEPITLIVGWRSGSKVKLGKFEKQDEVDGEIRSIVDGAMQRWLDLDYRPWDPDAADEGDQVQVFKMADVNDAPAVSWDSKTPIGEPALLPTLLDPVDLPTVDPKKLSSILLYAFVAKMTDGSKIAFIRKSNPKRYLESTRLFVDFTAPSLKLAVRDIMSFDQFFDFIASEDSLAVANMRTFEMVFRDNESLKVRIPLLVNSFAGGIALADKSIEALTQTTTRLVRPRRKLETILRRGHLANVTAQVIRQRLLEQGPDRLAECLDDDDALIFTESNAEFLLAFLNEDLFKGALTDEGFQADRKVKQAP